MMQRCRDISQVQLKSLAQIADSALHATRSSHHAERETARDSGVVEERSTEDREKEKKFGVGKQREARYLHDQRDCRLPDSTAARTPF